MIPRYTDSRPLVSVVLAVLNPHPLYFPLAVRSILDQTLEQFELIIIEDPSPRSAGDMLAGLQDPRIRYHANPRPTGLVRQRNQGIRNARAELVAIFDADDIAEPTRLQEQADYLNSHPDIGAIGSQISVIDEAGNLRGYRRFPLEHEAIVEAMPRIVPFSHPSMMFRRSVVLDAGAYRHSEDCTAEDYELWSRLALRGVRFANHPDVLVRYRIHPGQMKWTYLRSTIRNILSVKNKYWRDKMDFRARATMWAERLLLWLPHCLAYHLVVLTLYSDSFRAQRKSRSCPLPQGQAACAPPRVFDPV